MSGAIHICPGPTVSIREGTQERWCFGCRKRLIHTWQLLSDPPERQPSYYEPTWICRCSRCKFDRTDFPGSESYGGPPPEVETMPTGRDPFREAIEEFGEEAVMDRLRGAA